MECYTLTDLILERHAQEKHAFMLLTDPEKAREQVRMRLLYEKNPWSFLVDCVYTLDSVDQVSPIKPFPGHLDYLRFICDLWLRERLLAFPKSRRMFCSWSMISLYTHDTIFKPGRFNGFVSKKEDDAGDLVSRAEFIFKHIPEWRIPRPLLPVLKNNKMSKQPPVMEFEEINSKIQGFPQGADQLRQFTLSGILGDECAFWPEAQQFYSASAPTLEGGGRMTLISSRSPGFFKKITFDQLDAKDLSFREEPPAPVVSPIEGVDVWRNPRNKFVIVDLHYTANPAKRGAAWREAVKASMPIRDFLMEYEKSWQTYEGKPVYEDYIKSIHAVKRSIEPEPGLPLILGWDFGLTPACVIGQLVGTQLRILKEFVEEDGSILKLAPKVWEHLKTEFPEWHRNDEKIISFIDPAGFKRAETDERTCAMVLGECGFTKVMPGPVTWEPRRQAVEKLLVRMNRGEPALIIAEPDCPVLQEGFGGGYHYPEKVLEIEPAKARPEKNKFSHPHDALQYLCFGATGVARKHGINLTAPSYGFQQG